MRPALDHLRAMVLLALPALVAATPVELTVHIATDADGKAAVEPAWLDAALATANERLGPAGVAFTVAAASGDGVPADIPTVAERDALARVVGAGALHVFVVARLADKDRDGGRINGVTWRYAGADRALRGRRYIVVARDALVDTLAHELGHYFGLAHTTDPTNLMMAPGREAGAGLDAAQVRTVRRRAAAWARRCRPARSAVIPAGSKRRRRPVGRRPAGRRGAERRGDQIPYSVSSPRWSSAV